MPGEPRAPPAGLGWLALVKGLAAVFAGILFGLNCLLSPAFPSVFLPFIGGSGPATFAWAAPAGVLLGLGFSLLGRALKGGRAGGSGARLPVAVVVGFISTVVLFIVEPLGTAQFFLLLFFLFPCAILVHGALNGRLWAVAAGALLQLLIGLGTTLDGQNLPGLLAYAIVYLAALELSWSSAAMTAALQRELAQAPGERVMLRARATLDRAAGNYLARLLACGTAAAFVVALALSMFGSPGLFGPAYAESFEARTLTGLFLPGAAVLAALAAGLLVPPDLLPRTRAFAARARLAARALAVTARPRPKEDEPETS
jgi:hypothetical protein